MAASWHWGRGYIRRVSEPVTEPRLSVVMAVYNGLPGLRQQLQALDAQVAAPPHEVVIADNGSTDGSLAVLQEWVASRPTATLVDARARRGQSYARNVGASASSGALLVFCDQDDVVSPGWLAAFDRARGSAALLGGSLETESLNDRRTRAWRGSHDRHRLAVSQGHLPYALGCNIAVQRDVFEALGGFDEDLVGGGEDVDLCWRAQHAGHTLAKVPDALVAYRFRSGLWATVRQSYEYGRADARVAAKHRGQGLGQAPWTEYARAVVWLSLRVPYLVMGDVRAGLWLRFAAQRLGRLLESRRRGVRVV